MDIGNLLRVVMQNQYLNSHHNWSEQAIASSFSQKKKTGWWHRKTVPEKQTCEIYTLTMGANYTLDFNDKNIQ